MRPINTEYNNLADLKALDTETTSDGKAVIVANESQYIRPHSFEDIANFLKPRKRGKQIYETWNLRYDYQAILKWVPPEYWPELYDKGEVEYNGYKLKLIPKKRFSIGYPYKRGEKISYYFAHMYDMAAFYGYQHLGDAAKQYLNEEKRDYASWVNTVQTLQDPEKELEFLDQNEEGVGKYCILDALLTLKLSRYMLSTLEAIGVDVSNPISQAYLAGKLMQAKNPEYPYSNFKFTEKYTKPTFRGGMFSCMQRGLFEQEIYEYDINSAYPSVQYQLPHWNDGKFELSDDPDEILSLDYGWVLAEFDCEYIPYPKTCPVIVEDDIGVGEGFQKFLVNNKLILYPSGRRVQPVTLLEVKWMLKHGFPCEVIGGLVWKPDNENYRRPFAYMKELYDQRIEILKKDKTDMRQYAIKIILNSTYGKTAQDPEKYGYRSPTTDFGYASYITAATRLKVAEVAVNHPGKVIEIATDGVYLLEPAPELYTPEEKVLGAWEMKKYERGLWIAGGIKQLFNADGTFVTKARGISKDRKFNLEEELRKVGKDKYVECSKIKPLTLGEILRAIANPVKYNPALLNKFAKHSRRLNTDMDVKRCWSRTPQNWDEFLDGGPITSRPWTIEELESGKWAGGSLSKLMDYYEDEVDEND